MPYSKVTASNEKEGFESLEENCTETLNPDPTVCAVNFFFNLPPYTAVPYAEVTLPYTPETPDDVFEKGIDTG